MQRPGGGEECTAAHALKVESYDWSVQNNVGAFLKGVPYISVLSPRFFSFCCCFYHGPWILL